MFFESSFFSDQLSYNSASTLYSLSGAFASQDAHDIHRLAPEAAAADKEAHVTITDDEKTMRIGSHISRMGEMKGKGERESKRER